MYEYRDLIIDKLRGDPIVTQDFTGGVWDRIPRVGTGSLATPGAFYTSSESQKEAGRLKPTIAVIDGGDNPAPDGAARSGFMGFPLVYGYVIPNQDGYDALTMLENRLHFHFHRGLSYPRLDNTGMEIVVLERQPIRDGDEFGYDGRIFTIWRLQVTYVRLPVGV